MKTESLDNKFRYERKFLISRIDRISVENLILKNPAFFTEIFHERWVNNIYFDYQAFNNFIDNIEGNMFRKKYRIRWYGEMLNNIDKPILELKIKEGLLGDKKSFKLIPFRIDKGINSSVFKDVIKNSNIDSKTKLNMQDQIPVMLNRYKRKYFESSDKKFRITIDDQQSFYKLNSFNNTFLQKLIDSKNVILEIKYNKKYDSEAAKITNNFPFRLTKSSKYAKGIELLYF